MSKLKLKFVKKFLEKNLKKNFIKASKASYFLPILLARKPGEGIKFCVDYKRLNKFTKKNAYLIPLIAKTLAQLKDAKMFAKIDIQQIFYKLCMAANLKDLTIIATRFDVYK